MGAAIYTLCTSKSILLGATDYTDSCNIRFAQGHMSALIVLAAASNVTITQQCSLNDSDWYDPVDINGTALGVVYAALTSSAYIEFSPIPAVWMRFKIVAAANSTITMTVLSKE